jgi:hypothetical protein
MTRSIPIPCPHCRAPAEIPYTRIQCKRHFCGNCGRRFHLSGQTRKPGRWMLSATITIVLFLGVGLASNLIIQAHHMLNAAPNAATSFHLSHEPYGVKDNPLLHVLFEPPVPGYQEELSPANGSFHARPQFASDIPPMVPAELMTITTQPAIVRLTPPIRAVAHTEQESSDERPSVIAFSAVNANR